MSSACRDIGQVTFGCVAAVSADVRLPTSFPFLALFPPRPTGGREPAREEFELEGSTEPREEDTCETDRDNLRGPPEADLAGLPLATTGGARVLGEDIDAHELNIILTFTLN